MGRQGRRSKSSERPHHDLPMLGYPIAFCHQDNQFRLRRRNSSLENLNQIFALDETSDKPKENRIVKFHDEAPERGRSPKKSKSKVKSRSLVRTSTSILKDTSNSSSVNLNPDPKSNKDDSAVVKHDEDVKPIEMTKKKDKKKKRGKSDEKSSKKDPVTISSISSPNPAMVNITVPDKSVPSSEANISFPLNLSTEESGYESDLTRKTSSKVGTGHS